MWDDHELFCCTNGVDWDGRGLILHQNTNTKTREHKHETLPKKTHKKTLTMDSGAASWWSTGPWTPTAPKYNTKTQTQKHGLKHVRWPWWSRWPWTNNAPTDWLCCRGLLSRKSGGQRQITSYELWQHTLDCSSKVPIQPQLTISPFKLKKKEPEQHACLPV